jgi:hypothetical protein
VDAGSGSFAIAVNDDFLISLDAKTVDAHTLELDDAIPS